MPVKELKIFVTKFIHDELEYVGPDIHAESFEQAELIAEMQGLIFGIYCSSSDYFGFDWTFGW